MNCTLPALEGGVRNCFGRPGLFNALQTFAMEPQVDGCELGSIQLDSETRLDGVPAVAWNYQLGGRSALDWILDQYKEKTPTDVTIRDKFNTYRLADHKEGLIDLLQRVTRVSVETMEIVDADAPYKKVTISG